MELKALNQSHSTSRKMLDAPADASESSMEKALGMGETLEAIFTHLPTNLILSSCSLVNNFWNSEARTFVRDHRICTFDQPACELTCEMLQILDELCGEIADTGRVVPFNSLKVRFSGSCFEDFSSNEETSTSEYETDSSDAENSLGVVETSGVVSENSNGLEETSGEVEDVTSRVENCSNSDDEDSYTVEYRRREKQVPLRNVASNLKLRYLEIYGPDSNYHKHLATLLKHSSSQLRSWISSSIYPYRRLKVTEWNPRFPRLEYFSMTYTCPDELFIDSWSSLQYESEEMQKGILHWLLKDAPNLKRINLGVLDLLNIVPEELLPRVELQGAVDIHLNRKEDLDLFPKLSYALQYLSHIRIFASHENLCALVEEEEEVPMNMGMVRQFDLELEQVLKNHHAHLKIIEIVELSKL